MAEKEKDIVKEGDAVAEEKVEDATERATEGTRGRASEVASEGTRKTSYCSLCGASVVPEEVETPTGIRYKCPTCKRFMKPVTDAEKRREEETGPLPPVEVLVTERLKELLVTELPRVYGIPKKDASKTITAIIDTLTPPAAMNPWNLHSHIKDFAENANDRHLESIINKIFYQLEEEGYLPGEQEYQPRYQARTGRRVVRPRYSGPDVSMGRPRHGSSWGYGYDDYGERHEDPRGERPYYEWDYEDYPPRMRRQTSRMKVSVDGQVVETDFEGYMAHKRWQQEQAEEKRRQEEHEVRMKKLEAEILKITSETASSKNQALVKVKVGEEMTEVPASIAPLYLRRDEPLVKVKVGEETMEVPANIAPLYLRRDDRELREIQDKLEKEREERLKEREERHQAEMRRLEEKIGKEPLVKVKVGEETMEVPAGVAPLYLKRDDKELKGIEEKLDKEREERLREREERHRADIERLEKKMEEQPSFMEQLEAYTGVGAKLGLKQGGRTTIDVLSNIGESLDRRAGQLLDKLPAPGGEFHPEVTRTPEERAKVAEEMKRKLAKSEEILAAEDELIRTASQVE